MNISVVVVVIAVVGFALADICFFALDYKFFDTVDVVGIFLVSSEDDTN